MSETVHYKGTATKVEVPDGKTLNEVADQILKDRNIKLTSYYDSAVVCLSEELYNEYFYHPMVNTLYKITKSEHDLEEEIIRADYNQDGNINYELKYYNGGAGFNECLEEAFDKLVRQENIDILNSVAKPVDPNAKWKQIAEKNIEAEKNKQSITFDKEAQDNLPQEIKDRMKADRKAAEENSKNNRPK